MWVAVGSGCHLPWGYGERRPWYPTTALVVIGVGLELRRLSSRSIPSLRVWRRVSVCVGGVLRRSLGARFRYASVSGKFDDIVAFRRQ